MIHSQLVDFVEFVGQDTKICYLTVCVHSLVIKSETEGFKSALNVKAHFRLNVSPSVILNIHFCHNLIWEIEGFPQMASKTFGFRCPKRCVTYLGVWPPAAS